MKKVSEEGGAGRHEGRGEVGIDQSGLTCIVWEAAAARPQAANAGTRGAAV